MKRALIVLLASLAGAVAAGAEKPPSITQFGREVAKMQARPFDLKRVRLLDGPFKDAMERDRRYLHDLESDRLLHMFRVTAGLPAPAEPMGGWELLELRGHTLGHYLSACAMMYASTGDEKLKAKAETIVAELAKCQKALGSGYLSAFPEEFIDRVVACKPVWAPWYTLHKIYAGLIDMYIHCGNGQALEVAKGMAAWAKTRLDPLDEQQMQQMLNATEQGGMNDALSNLYAVTGNPDHLRLARRFDQKSYNDPLAKGEDHLRGLHVNSFIPNIIGTAREYELTGEKRNRKIAEYFWNQVVDARCYCTGGTSNHEAWRTEPYKLATELSPESQETCCTYNMLKLTRHLFGWNPVAKCADYYERALYNGILATQDPRSGMMMYYVALNPGHWKVFNTPRDSFWCCTGTGMENHAKYGESIYFHDDQGVFVNLFIASELTWPEKGLRIRQETKFPEEEDTTLIISAERPVELALRIRVPYWATRGVTVKINGRAHARSTKPASYLTLKRTWNSGDRVGVALPMSLHLHPMPDDPDLVAIMYGPLVLAGRLGTEELTEDVQNLKGQREQNRGPSIRVPDFVFDDDFTPSENPLKVWIKPVEGEPLAFRTIGVGRPYDVTLIPFHKLFGQRYSVYWRISTEKQWRAREAERNAREARGEARRKALAARTVDRVVIANGPSEKEHQLQGERTVSGRHAGRNWRDARGGGWFSYTLKVLPAAPVTLICTYWGSDVGRTFDVLIDGEKIGTQTLNRNKPNEFFEVEYKIPPELTRGKQKITVKFQAHPGSYAGGVFGCMMLKAGK